MDLDLALADKLTPEMWQAWLDFHTQAGIRTAMLARYAIVGCVIVFITLIVAMVIWHVHDIGT